MAGKLISFEGVDGAGKTYWAKQMQQYFGEKSIFLSRKELVPSQNEYLNKVNQQLGNILWKSESGDPIELLTDSGWLHLHLAWYHIFDNNIIQPLKEQFEYIFIDGWYYKIMARFMKKEEYSNVTLWKLFSELCQADKIIFLDENIELCYKRKTVFTKCELGKMDDVIGSEKEAFIRYQTQIREAYLEIPTYSKKDFDIIKDSNETEIIRKIYEK